MIGVELSKQIEIRNNFEEGALLVPVAMKLIANEDFSKVISWGDHYYWVNVTLEKIGVRSLIASEGVMEMIKAGKRRAWGLPKGRLETVVVQIIRKSQSVSEIESRRVHLTELAIKATVMAMVGGELEQYRKGLAYLRFMRQEPDVFDELLGQLGVTLDRQERGRILELLAKVDI